VLSTSVLFPRKCRDIKYSTDIISCNINTLIIKSCEIDKDLYESNTINSDFYVKHKEGYVYYYHISHKFPISGKYNYEKYSSDLESIVLSLFEGHYVCMSIEVGILVTATFVQ
jgi:hypothetical protein